MSEYKTYRKTATVQAKLFAEGDEDGFLEGVPYVSTLENQHHLSEGFGKDYICIGKMGERWLNKKENFENSHEEVDENI